MKKESGFTLMELLVVVAIVAILTAIAIPNFLNWRRNAQMRSAADEVRAAVELTKLRAVKDRAPCVVLFNTVNNNYTAFIDNGAGGGTADNEVRDGGEAIITQNVLPGTVQMYSASFSGGVPRLRFRTNGIPNRFGSVRLRNSDLSMYRMISVSITGFTKIRRSNDGVNWQG